MPATAARTAVLRTVAGSTLLLGAWLFLAAMPALADGGPHVATVHVCTSPTRPYVSILVDGGTTKNLNTRPVNRDLTRP